MSWDERAGRSVGVWLADEWRSATMFLRGKWKLIAAGFIVAGLAFGVVAAAAVRPSMHELPFVLLAGFVHAFGYVSLFGLLWCAVVARIVYVCVFEWAERGWVERERRRRPNQSSFPIPFLRFWLTAMVPSVLLFLVLASPFVAVFVIADGQPTVHRVLSLLNPPND